jgi:hypothetical protein
MSCRKILNHTRGLYFHPLKEQVQLFRNHTQFTTIALLVLILILLLYLLAESNRRSNAIDKRLQQSPTEKLISQ